LTSSQLANIFSQVAILQAGLKIIVA